MTGPSDVPPATGKRVFATGASLSQRARTSLAQGRPLRVRLQNIGHMLSGSAVSAIFALVSLGIVMRSLEPAQYGVMALVLSYGRFVERVIRFESWQPLIKYAVAVRGPDAKQDLRQLYGFGLRIDAAACALAAAVALALGAAATPLLGLDPQTFGLIAIYSGAILVNATGMPTAVLRLAGKFKTLAYVQASGNVLRVALCVIGLWYGASLTHFMVIWATCQIFTTICYFVLAGIELRRQGIGNPITVSCRGVTRRFEGIMQFAWSSNLSMTVGSSANDLDVLLVGWLSDEVSAGLYYFAKRFAKSIRQTNAQVQAVLYPDLARLWEEGAYQKFVRATSQIQLFLALCFAVAFGLILMFGADLIRYGPGPQYLGALPMLLVQIIAVAITAHAGPSRTALLAMGRQLSVLKIVVFATMLFLCTLVALVPVMGATGANVAHVLLALVCAICFDVILRRGVASARSQRAAAKADAGASLG